MSEHRDFNPPDDSNDCIACVGLRAENAALQRQVAEAVTTMKDAIVAARRETKERCAEIVRGWHYKKGGYEQLAHALLALPNQPNASQERKDIW